MPIDRNAGALLHVLRIEHPGEHQDFVIANAMATMLGMNRHTFTAARKALEAQRHIVLVKPASSITPAVYRWPQC